MNKKIKATLAYYIEEFLICILVIYMLLYYILSLYEQSIIYNYILIIFMGTLIGCKLTKWCLKLMKIKNDPWRNDNRNI